jgi:hypothetical protein
MCMNYLDKYKIIFGKRLRLSKEDVASGLSREEIAKKKIEESNHSINSQDRREVSVTLKLVKKSNFPEKISIKIDEHFIDWFEILNERYNGDFEKMIEHALNFGIGYMNDKMPNKEIVQKFIEQGKIIYQK